MENYRPYESNRCSMHHERPAESQCAGCGEFFCGECLESHGNCPACSNAAERFLEGFSTALTRWESGLRDPNLASGEQPGNRSGKKYSWTRIAVFLLLGSFVAYIAYFLSDYNLNMGRLYLEQGNYPKALQYFENSLANDPGNSGLHFALGDLNYQLGDMEAAIDQYRDCLTIDSTHASAMNNLAWVYTQLDIELEEALELSSRAVEMEPENPVFLDTLAEVYYLRKEYYRALTFMRKAVEQDPPDIEYYLGRLGKIKKLAYGEGRFLEV
ncbi:MAG: tetratricopeptide repeat protein [Candidatus Glassbacteria bacterium]|nr:tetratricopeptide repeat protein [Candidatus Glassbacteria bacterium]